MTLPVTTAWTAVAPVYGASSIIIGNPLGGAAIQVSQRFSVAGTAEAGNPTTDPGFTIAAGSSIILPFGQTIWIRGDSAQNITVTPFA